MIFLVAMLGIGFQEPKVENPVIARKQAAYKEWAKALRETGEQAKKVPEKKRDAWATKTLRDKEGKIRAKYKVAPIQLTIALKEGLILKWPTEMPGDVAYVRATLDPLIFQDELSAWSRDNAPARRGIPRSASAQDVSGIMQEGMNDQIRNEKNAPIAKCPGKDATGRICDRRTVGPAGTKCYEHRH